MSGSFSSGSASIVFLKDSAGPKVGLMAGVERMKLSDIIESFNGMDISETPYFGQLTLSMAVSVTSGPIERARLTDAIHVVPYMYNIPDRSLPVFLSYKNHNTFWHVQYLPFIAHVTR